MSILTLSGFTGDFYSFASDHFIPLISLHEMNDLFGNDVTSADISPEERRKIAMDLALKSSQPMEVYKALGVNPDKSDLERIALKSEVDYNKPVGELKPFWQKGQVIAAGVLLYLGSLIMPGLAANSYAEEVKPRGYVGETDPTKPVVQDGFHGLPCTDGWKALKPKEIDLDERVPGKESVARGYQKGNILLIMAYYRDKDQPWAFWYIDRNTNEAYDTRVDVNADGNYETFVAKGESDVVADINAWGIK